MASPGPFTTQPITDNVIGVVICSNLFSSSPTVFITLKFWRAHDGQEIILTPLCLKFRDLSILNPTLISSTGSADSETLIVSPIPAQSKDPIPIEDLIVPGIIPPASVIPKWIG